MSEVLFCHDGPMRIDENGDIYGGAHNNEMFQRYFNIADNITVLIRLNKIKKKEAVQSYSKITLPSIKFKQVPNLSSLEQLLLNNNAKKIISEAVKKADYIVVRLHSVIGTIAYDYAQKYKKPCLVEVVGCPWDAYWNHSLKGKFAALPMYLATKNRIKEANHVVYVTNEFLQKRYPTTGINTNLSNVMLDDFNDEILEKRLTKIRSISEEEKIIIGTTAALDVRYKGQQYIIEALSYLRKQGIEKFEYHLVGGGDPEYLKSMAEKHDVSELVKVIGSLPHNEVFKWLEEIDIYTQPSRQEGLPRALIEAMSKGLPAFGAKTAGIPELLENEFIFSNTKKNISEISEILMSIDKNVMRQQAMRNYYEAKKYDSNIIEQRRKLFFEEFKSSFNLN